MEWNMFMRFVRLSTAFLFIVFAAVLFAGVHEAVGSFDDFVCALASVSDGGADTDGDADLLVVTGQPGVLDQHADPLGDAGGPVFLGFGQDGDELLTAPAAGQVPGS